MRRARLLGSLAVVLGVFGVAAQEASAGTVTGFTFTRFLADPGETNIVTVDRSGNDFVFTDTGTPITVGRAARREAIPTRRPARWPTWRTSASS